MTYTNSRVTTQSGGVFFPLLAVLFIGLKLTGYIGWSWWWVLAPLWAPAVLGLVVLAGWLILWVVIGGEGRRELRLDRSMRRYSDRFRR